MTSRLGLRPRACLTKGFHTKASLARTACGLLGRNGLHGTGPQRVDRGQRCATRLAVLPRSSPPKLSSATAATGHPSEERSSVIELANSADTFSSRGLRTQCESIYATWRNTIASGLLEPDSTRRTLVAALVLMTPKGALICVRLTRNPAVLLEAASSLANLLCSRGD